MSRAPRPESHLWSIPASLAAFCFTVNVLKGIRMPSRWAVTNYLFNYDTGFVKRAAWGEVLQRSFGAWTHTYFFMAGVALIVFAALVMIAVRHVRRVPTSDDRFAFVLVSCCSPAVAFMAHTVGYLEHLIYLALLMVFALARSWRVLVLALGALALVLPLVHEGSISWTVGLVVLALLVLPVGGAPSPRARGMSAAGIAALWLASTAVVWTIGRATPERAAVLRDAGTATFDIRPRQDAFTTLSRDLGENVRETHQLWIETDLWVDMVYSIAVFGPAAIFLFVVTIRRLRSENTGLQGRRAIELAVLLSVASPVLLHAVAWDLHRWNALATLNAALAAMLVLGSTRGAEHAGTGKAFLAMAVGVALWSLAADPILFDGYVAQHPPFLWHVQFLVEALTTGGRDIWIPLPGN